MGKLSHLASESPDQSKQFSLGQSGVVTSELPKTHPRDVPRQ